MLKKDRSIVINILNKLLAITETARERGITSNSLNADNDALKELLVDAATSIICSSFLNNSSYDDIKRSITHWVDLPSKDKIFRNTDRMLTFLLEPYERSSLNYITKLKRMAAMQANELITKLRMRSKADIINGAIEAAKTMKVQEIEHSNILMIGLKRIANWEDSDVEIFGTQQEAARYFINKYKSYKPNQS